MAEVELGSRYYTEEHEWFEYNGGILTVGITDHAQEALGDLVYVGDFPDIGTKVDAGDVIAVVESVKATSDVYSPVSGVVEAFNQEVEESPELMNQDAEGDGWLLRLRVTEVPRSDDFMDPDAYAEFCANQD
jgi:glycine cleavage system H protein